MSPQTEFIVYFLYGLTFFSMGLVMMLESWRIDPSAPQVGLIRPLAFFGLLHGMHEWLEIFILQMEYIGEGLAVSMKWLRLALLGISFMALWVYSLAAFRFAREHIAGLTVFGMITLPMFALLALVDVINAYQLGDVSLYRLVGSLVRYGLGVTGAAVAAIGLHAAALKANADGRKNLDRYLNLTAIGFGLYSVTQLFVPAMNTHLGYWLNAEAFQLQTGLPIQVIRTVAAMIITLGLFNAVHFLETERQFIVAAAQKARMEALEQQETMRRDLLRHIVRAQEEERARISRELHDEMAQTLTALTLDIGSLGQLISKHSKAMPVLARLQGLGQEMSHSMSRMVRDLRPALLDDLGLVSALKYLAENEAPRLGLFTSFEVFGMPRRIESFVETVLFRITQEALTNVSRHAQTTNVNLCLEFSDVDVVLTISDQGIGFDPSQSFIPPRGLGLAGMKERVASTGGQLHIVSQPGHGTVIRAAIPLSVTKEKVS